MQCWKSLQTALQFWQEACFLVRACVHAVGCLYSISHILSCVTHCFPPLCVCVFVCVNVRVCVCVCVCVCQIEQFWQVYNHIVSPHAMEVNSNLHYFKQGIQPLWEDPANQDGGKWVLTIRNDQDRLAKCWMEVVSGCSYVDRG